MLEKNIGEMGTNNTKVGKVKLRSIKHLGWGKNGKKKVSFWVPLNFCLFFLKKILKSLKPHKKKGRKKKILINMKAGLNNI